MRIIHLLGDLKLPLAPDQAGMSGVVRAALEIARAQVRRGHAVSIAAVGQTPGVAAWHGVDLLVLRPKPWARAQVRGRAVDFRIHLPYVMLTRARRFDVVQGHLYSYLRFLRARLRIAHFHSDPFFSGSGMGSAFSVADADVIKQSAHAQVAVSRFVAEQLRRALGVIETIHVVPNGVDAEHFNPARHAEARARQRLAWGAEADDLVFLYAGAVVPEKGVLHLARVFARVSEQVSNVHLVVAGGRTLWEQSLQQEDPHRDYEAAVHAVLAPARERRRAHLLGSIAASAMPMIAAASDVVVIPSICAEGFPLIALEALASERPVIASAVGGLPEIVDETTGILVPPGDEAALADAIWLLIKDRARGRMLGVAGRARALRFSWDETARALDDVYARYLQASGGRRA